MSNKLPKNTKSKTDKKKQDSTMKTFFSFNPVGNKVFSLYEDGKKREATVARHGVNNIISTILIMIVLTVFAYKTQEKILMFSGIAVCIIESAIAVWKLYKGNSKKIWYTNISINILFLLVNMIMIFV